MLDALCPHCGEPIRGPMFFANPTRASAHLTEAGILGFIDTPRQGNRRPPGVVWCADNGCFSDKFDEPVWFRWLRNNAFDAATCRFAVAPDVMGDAAATFRRSQPWLPKIRDLGYPVAYVAQDGVENTSVPWRCFDVLFIGGSTEFKLGPHAARAAQQALERGKSVHMGRVNSRKRWKYAASLGCTSVDGTFLTFGAKVNVPRLMGWFHENGCAA